MVYKGLSTRVKNRKKGLVKENSLQNAKEAYIKAIEHERKVAEWKLTCEKLQKDGVPKRNWPKGPTRPRKPKLPANFGAIVDDDEEEDDENDND